jgi:hypothetical protein
LKVVPQLLHVSERSLIFGATIRRAQLHVLVFDLDVNLLGHLELQICDLRSDRSDLREDL